MQAVIFLLEHVDDFVEYAGGDWNVFVYPGRVGNCQNLSWGEVAVVKTASLPPALPPEHQDPIRERALPAAPQIHLQTLAPTMSFDPRAFCNKRHAAAPGEQQRRRRTMRALGEPVNVPSRRADDEREYDQATIVSALAVQRLCTPLRSRLDRPECVRVRGPPQLSRSNGVHGPISPPTQKP